MGAHSRDGDAGPSGCFENRRSLFDCYGYTVDGKSDFFHLLLETLWVEVIELKRFKSRFQEHDVNLD